MIMYPLLEITPLKHQELTVLGQQELKSEYLKFCQLNTSSKFSFIAILLLFYGK